MTTVGNYAAVSSVPYRTGRNGTTQVSFAFQRDQIDTQNPAKTAMATVVGTNSVFQTQRTGLAVPRVLPYDRTPRSSRAVNIRSSRPYVWGGLEYAYDPYGVLNSSRKGTGPGPVSTTAYNPGHNVTGSFW
jgi:hypothetical protein